MAGMLLVRKGCPVRKAVGIFLPALAFVLLALVGTSQASPIDYSAYLNGPNEFPSVLSPGTGIALVTIDTAAHTLRVQVTFEDLVGTTTVAHIHASTAVAGTGTVGVATMPGTFPGFPAG